jgi:hypothetical protein
MGRDTITEQWTKQRVAWSQLFEQINIFKKKSRKKNILKNGKREKVFFFGKKREKVLNRSNIYG